MTTLQRQQTQKGFTMVELLITVGILGVLAAFATPAMVKTMRKTQLNSEVNAVVESLQQARADAVIQKRARTSVMPTLQHTQSTPQAVAVQYDFMGRATVANDCVNIVMEHTDDPNIVASIEVRAVGRPEVLKLRQSQCR